MKASVIIPAYNEEKWIAKTLYAALAQEYPDYEVIVVNNASSDNTAHVVETIIKDNPRARLVHEKRKGLLFAREAGRKAATGDILVQLDADCIPTPDWLTKGMSYFKNPKIVAASGPYRFYDASKTIRLATTIGQEFIYGPASELIQTFGKGALLIGGNAFIRAIALEAIGGYDTSIDFYSEDSDTGYRLSKVGKVVYRSRLTIDSSARRFKAFGFSALNKRYTEAFLTVIFGKKLQNNKETIHPR